MSIKEKLAKVKTKLAQHAVKGAVALTLAGGSGMASSCVENGIGREDGNAERMERVGETERVETKTSVAFRVKQDNFRTGTKDCILLENGDVLKEKVNGLEPGHFIEPGDTVTYEGDKVTAVRYKGGEGKKVNFGKIGKIDRGR